MRFFHWIVTATLGFVLSACADTGTKSVQKEANAAAEQVLAVAEATTPSVVSADKYPGPAKQPNFGPAYGSITFVDTDSSDAIGGLLSMGRAIDAQGDSLDESEEGISMYMIHWGLVVGQTGVDDDKGAGDLGGDCRGFRDTGHIVMQDASKLSVDQPLEWEVPTGTVIPQGAIYFVGHSVYGKIHNLAKCTQIPIVNWIE